MEIASKAAGMLGKTDVITLASINEKGYPRICVLSKIKSDGIKKLWVSTSTSSKKARHFMENPKASVCFYNAEDSVTLTGKVSIIQDPTVKAEMWQDWFINHYPGGMSDPDYCILEFVTDEATLWIDNEFVTLRDEQL